MPIKAADTARRVRLLRTLVPVGRVLDVGCGSGALLHRCRDEAGLDVSGVEPDRRFRESLLADGFDVRSTLGEFTSERFDAVLVIHVLEHAESPVRFLHDLRDHLREGAPLIVEVPSLTDPLLWIYAVPDFWRVYWQFPHVWYFSPRPLRTIVEAAGYRIDALDLTQRYGLANHLSWLTAGHGGDGRFESLAPSSVDRGYREALVRNGSADTIWAVCRADDTPR